MDQILATERIHRAKAELDKALRLIEEGQLRDSIKHLDFSKDSTIAAIHLTQAEISELEGGE